MVTRIEKAIERAVILDIRKAYPDIKIFATRNEEGHKSPETLDIGLPDLLLFKRHNGILHTLFLELKTKKGKLRKTQIAWNADFDSNFRSENASREIAYGYEEVIAKINEWNKQVILG